MILRLLACLVLAVLAFTQIGSIFIPVMDEGTPVVTVRKHPTIGVEEAAETDQRIAREMIARVPEILTAERGVRDLFIAPRGSSKSTHLSLGLALYCIMLRKTRYCLEVCDVYAQAALLIEALKAELTTNPRLQNDFPDACGQGRVWREGEIVTRQDIRVEGLGALQKLRGRRHGPFRPDLMFFDDIENDEAVRSPEQRQKLENWIYRAALKVGPPDGSMHVVWVGTVLHFDAVLVRAAKKQMWRVTEFQAVIKWPDRMDLWDQFEISPERARARSGVLMTGTGLSGATIGISASRATARLPRSGSVAAARISSARPALRVARASSGVLARKLNSARVLPVVGSVRITGSPCTSVSPRDRAKAAIKGGSRAVPASATPTMRITDFGAVRSGQAGPSQITPMASTVSGPYLLSIR